MRTIDSRTLKAASLMYYAFVKGVLLMTQLPLSSR